MKPDLSLSGLGCPESEKELAGLLKIATSSATTTMACKAAIQRKAPFFKLESGKLCLQSKEGLICIDQNGAKFLSSGIDYQISFRDFSFLGELGRGQYGVVFLAKHQGSGKLMALKDLRIEVSNDALRQIATELEILKRAQSPHVLDFYGAFFNKSSIFICLEYMDLGSLEDIFFHVGRLPEDVVAAIAFTLIKALSYLSTDLKVIHRDIKPSNILISMRGKVKIGDFGVSGFLIKSLAKTQIGSVCYMAPERVVMGTEMCYDSKADVWSLGVTLWELATGRPLFRASNYDSPFAQLMNILHGPDPELPKEMGFSQDFHDLIEPCLRRDSQRRPSLNTLSTSPRAFQKYLDGGQSPIETIFSWIFSCNVKQKIEEGKMVSSTKSKKEANSPSKRARLRTLNN